MSSNEQTRVTGDESPSVTLVSTILNEADQLPDLLHSIELQTLAPRRIIFVDGGSTDDSMDILELWKARLPITVLSAPGANISAGRNIGIDRADSPIIAVTDAGSILEPDWLENLVRPFGDSGDQVDVVGGFFKPDARNTFEHLLAATTLPEESEVAANTFLPSSRSVAFRRSWVEAGAQYPEWLDYCEDVVFDLRMKRAGARFAFQPTASVRFRPRGSLGAFWRQYYLYARGDGKAGLFLNRHLARYLTYFLIVPSLVLVKSWPWRLVVLVGTAAYMRRPMQRLATRATPDRPLSTGNVLGTAFLRAIGDLAKMVGYPVGLLWRARRFGLRRDWRSIPE